MSLGHATRRRTPFKKRCVEVDACTAICLLCVSLTLPAFDAHVTAQGHTLEFLRENMHLRSRTNTIGGMLRVRNALTMAVHNYFQSQDFYCIHTPILTSNDCEGAGELFSVTGGPKHLQGGLFGKPAFLTVRVCLLRAGPLG